MKKTNKLGGRDRMYDMIEKLDLFESNGYEYEINKRERIILLENCIQKIRSIIEKKCK